MKPISELLRERIKALRMSEIDLRYRALTRWLQFGSPSGRAPGEFVMDAIEHARTHPDVAEFTRVVDPEMVDLPLPHAPPDIQAAYAPRTSLSFLAEGVFRYRRARVLGGYVGAVIAADGRLIVPFSTDPFGFGRHRSSARLWLPRRRKLRGKVAMIATPEAGRNYYHFTMDLLPRLFLLKQAGHPLESFDHILANLGGCLYEMPLLEKFGVPSGRLLNVESDSHFEIDELFVPTFRPAENGVAAWKVNCLRDAILGKQAGSIPVQDRKKLFLTRKNAAHRRIVNDREIQEAAEALGFTTIDCGALSVAEQIATFSTASHVAGMTGAAFTNLLYCPPDAKAVIILSADDLAGHYWSLNAVRGMPFTVVAGRPSFSMGSASGNRVSRVDIRVDIGEWVAALESTLCSNPETTLT